jgi:hypothetical protein
VKYFQHRLSNSLSISKDSCTILGGMVVQMV